MSQRDADVARLADLVWVRKEESNEKKKERPKEENTTKKPRTSNLSDRQPYMHLILIRGADTPSVVRHHGISPVGAFLLGLLEIVRRSVVVW